MIVLCIKVSKKKYKIKKIKLYRPTIMWIMKKGSTMIVSSVFLLHKVRHIFSADDMAIPVKTKLQKARNSELISMHIDYGITSRLCL